MIRINLIGAERRRVRQAIALDLAQSFVTGGCGLILVATLLLVGWWSWSLHETSAQVDADLVESRQEVARLEPLLREVGQFEQQSARLQERVALIEQLRRGQNIPVQLMDHVSRSLPDALWLTSMRQEGGQVTIEGRSTTLIALSDFVGNLGGGALLQRPIELVSSQVQPVAGTGSQATPELVQFTVRAQINEWR